MSIANYKCHVTSDAWCLFSRERWSKTEQNKPNVTLFLIDDFKLK